MDVIVGKSTCVKSKSDGRNRPQGHTSKRERISEEPITGNVVEWKGKYGWIQPSTTIDHEKAHKREGKIFVSISDLLGADALEVDSIVQFHLYVDDSGLGAEEVLLF